jgi:serpin B
MRNGSRTYFCLIALSSVFALVSCTKSNNSTSDQGGIIAQSSLARDMNPQSSDADMSAAVQGNTEFALKAFPLLDTNGNTNVVFSPYSITQALAMVAPGARGTTLTGIEKALSFSLTQDRQNRAFNRLDLLLASKATGKVQSNGDQSPQLSLVNAVWSQQSFTILPAYLDTLAVNYGAGLHLVDFVNASEPARATINSWVAGSTNNRIPELMSQGSVGSDTRLVLTNAVWFKANWATKFDPSHTTARSFFSRSNVSSSVPFMRKSVSVPYASASGYKAVDLPYVDNDLSMLLIMPDLGTFDAFSSAFTPTVLDSVVAQLTTTALDLAMPKFTFSTAPDMTATLKALGMTDAFEANKADLSGIDGARDLVITSVAHQAFINVDESGTEAAGATAVIIGITAAPVAPVSLTMDHPFLFMIRERQTGLILFIGKVVAL